jgi:cytochrome c oxidase subunit 1
VYILLLPVWGLMPHVLSTFSPQADLRLQGAGLQLHRHRPALSRRLGAPLLHRRPAGAGADLLHVQHDGHLAAAGGALLLLDRHHVERRDELRDADAVCIGFIVLFGIAGLTGLVLADVAADAQYHHSYFVVAHFHYALFAGGIMGVMTGVYYWLPKWTGHMYSEKLGKLHFWLTVISFNLTFMPQFFLGLAGMPRRIPDYALQFAEFNAISTVGAFILGSQQLIFAWNIWKCVKRWPEGRRTKVWEGAEGLEWELPSPPPHHSWETPAGDQVRRSNDRNGHSRMPTSPAAAPAAGSAGCSARAVALVIYLIGFCSSSD